MPTPGDVVLMPAVGVVASKVRPVVVLSSDLYHATRPDVVFGLLTGQVVKATAATDHTLLDWSAAGLTRPTAFRAYFYTELPQTVIKRIGHLSPRDWQAVRQPVRLALNV